MQDSFVGTVHKNTIHIYKATTMNYKINKKLNNKISDNTTLPRRLDLLKLQLGGKVLGPKLTLVHDLT